MIYAFIMYPQTLPPSYVRFIQKQGAKELYVYKGIQVGGAGLLGAGSRLCGGVGRAWVRRRAAAAAVHLSSKKQLQGLTDPNNNNPTTSSPTRLSVLSA